MSCPLLFKRLLPIGLLVATMTCVKLPMSESQEGTSFSSQALPRKLESKHLPNAIQLHSKVISGGQPDGEEAFRELKEMGIKTIISVDGAKPDLESARRNGLRYIHLPHGYNGIPPERIQELAKAVRDFDGPIYIHCHHGKHRSPAAATAACISTGWIDPSSANSILKMAGTSENYRGLYQAAESARKLDDSILNNLAVDFPEIAKLPPMAESMVALEHTHDHLKKFALNQWLPLSKQPDLDPAHEALILKEHFAEMLRMESARNQPKPFMDMLRKSEMDAERMEKELRAWVRDGRSAKIPTSIGDSFQSISTQCIQCHKQYRDTPL